jgi:hypothetical protein
MNPRRRRIQRLRRKERKRLARVQIYAWDSIVVKFNGQEMTIIDCQYKP